jgi:hypothetical protein
MSAHKKCARCGSLVPESAQRCRICRTPSGAVPRFVPAAERVRIPAGIILVALLIAVVLVIVVVRALK